MKRSAKISVFLTGVTGFLGGAVLAKLVDSAIPDEITCLVRGDDQECAEERVRRSGARFNNWRRLPSHVKVLRGDLLSDEWHTSPALNDLSHVLHLAANTSFGNSRGIRKTNVEGALSVASAMRGRSLDRYIHTGTATICGANPPPVVHEDDYPSANATHLVPYTRSKAEAEQLLAARYSDLPIVVARPSIVVGHTSLGCAPSGSIFWVLRAIEALRLITWDPLNKIDVIPVDWAASALQHLLFEPLLDHSRYHISAGPSCSISWRQLAAEYSRLVGGAAQNRYQVGTLEDLTTERIQQVDHGGHPRHLLQAMELYYRFCSRQLVFDNSRLLASGMAPPPRFTDYMGVCLESSPASIYEQMRMDLDPAAVLV